jgi:hypothetical protein
MHGIKGNHHTRILPPSVSELRDAAYAGDFFRIINAQNETGGTAPTIDTTEGYANDRISRLEHIGRTVTSNNGVYSIQEDVNHSDSSRDTSTTPTSGTALTSEESDEDDCETLPRLFILSASDEDGIGRITQVYQRHFDNLPLRSVARKQYIDGLSYTLNVRRTSLTWRSFVVLNPHQDLSCFQEALKAPTRSKISPHLSFVFSGQGAQWPRMGRELLAYPVFTSSLRVSQQILSEFGCSWLLLGSCCFLIGVLSLTNICR